LGWAEELKKDGIAANALWPRTTIDTAAVRNLLGGEALANMSRTVDVLADAAHIIFSKPSNECSGNLFVDEQVFAAEGITDLSKYSVVPGGKIVYGFVCGLMRKIVPQRHEHRGTQRNSTESFHH
jgi:citronellol/citronellal dehydrogenase